MRSIAPALLPIFRSQHQAELLARLFISGAEVAMTDLATELDVPLTTLHREANRLDEAGLLTSRRIGRTRLLRANSAHPAAEPLTEMLTAVYGPLYLVGAEFADLDADQVIIFGSWARRYAGENGAFPRDVDVLVVGDYALRTAAYGAADRVQRRLGIPVNTTHRTLAEWENEPSDPLVADIRERGFVHVLPQEKEHTWLDGDPVNATSNS